MSNFTFPITNAAKFLRKRGITSTLQRVKIVEVLFEKPQHLCADQVLEKVNNGTDYVSKATVYNTLKLLTEKGLAREVLADPAKAFYEPKITNHAHFFDIDSGELIDIEQGQADLKSLPDPPKDFSIVGVDVVIRIRDNR